MAAFSNAPEATFDDFYSSELARMGWQPHYEYGMLVGYWRPTALDDSRGARQAGVVDDRALEYVPADKINGGNPDPADLEYRTAGKNVVQNEPRGWDVLSTVGPAIIGTALGGAALTQAGLLGGGASGATTGIGSAASPVVDSSALFLGADPAILTQAGIDVPLTANAMSGAAGLSAGAPTMNSALLGGLGAAGLDLTNTALAGASGLVPGGGSFVTGAPSSVGGASPPPTTNPAPPTSPPTSPPTPPTAPPGFTLPTDLAEWARLIAPLFGGFLMAYEANQANKRDNPQDAYTRDYLRGLLSGPKATNESSGLLGTISQLQGKRYY